LFSVTSWEYPSFSQYLAFAVRQDIRRVEPGRRTKCRNHPDAVSGSSWVVAIPRD
jgi:hypothetical protein